MCIDELRTAFYNLEGILSEFNKNNFSTELEELGMTNFSVENLHTVKEFSKNCKCGLCILYNKNRDTNKKESVVYVGSFENLENKIDSIILSYAGSSNDLQAELYNFKTTDPINNLIINAAELRLSKLLKPQIIN